MEELKKALFARAKAEMDAYTAMEDGYSEEEKELQRQRFCAVWQAIEETSLADEYEAWKNMQ